MDWSFSAAGVSAAGDEPYMMAELYGKTVAVGKDRYHTGQELLGKTDVDVFILDDGFQHRRLRRDIDIVLLGRESPGSLLPCGPFRESSAALKTRRFLFTDGAGASLDADPSQGETRCGLLFSVPRAGQPSSDSRRIP